MGIGREHVIGAENGGIASDIAAADPAFLSAFDAVHDLALFETMFGGTGPNCVVAPNFAISFRSPKRGRRSLKLRSSFRVGS